MQLSTDGLSRSWLRLSAAFALGCRKGYTGEHLLWSPPCWKEYKYPHQPHESGAMGRLFSDRCLEAHQGFKLLPEWYYFVLFSFFSHGQVILVVGHPCFLCLSITALKHWLDGYKSQGIYGILNHSELWHYSWGLECTLQQTHSILVSVYSAVMSYQTFWSTLMET